MSDERKHQDPHQAEKQDAAAQLSAIDLINQGTAFVSRAFPFGGGVPRVFGKTDFESHDLNAMIDLVESAKPEDLETAGKALWDAKDAIEKAANELKSHIGRVEWEGESATAFHTWGENLVKHALELATFAETAGTQITAAATGLASVRSAMPPRDTRAVRKTVEDIPTPKQVDGNEEYTAAVKVEKDRQEAINQMNRLASFYEVSEGYLANQQAPTFEAMPDVGVPKPDPSYRDPFNHSDVQGGTGLGAGRESLAVGNDYSGTGTTHPRSEVTTPPIRHVDAPTTRPDVNVGTNIDSVGTLPPQETTRPATNMPTTGPGPSGG
ncbi:WXG100 family type VII secretion target, partial [Streptomyces resistomycificus]|uniref:WXG100 family type VII secretion target n=2 Tax=Streptomyces resistomycificus TaxID=67356 RepID=UPI0013E2C2E2